MLIPGYLLRHQVTVEPYEGDSAVGPLYGDPVTVRCFLEEETRLVRAPDGREVTSSSTIYCRLDAVTAPPESKVTLPDGRETTVIAQIPHNGGGLPTPDHLEVQLV
ncbi:hypothetical protein ABT063_24795 [Streptomyces sp. NPDC002838]|uniref:hypothetical protein n=1 Tax=Streptomyces sp. NPDC002838 TaxID=3154436 RepID=UPI00331E149A